MNSSYKVAIAVAGLICVGVLVYYVAQGGDDQPPVTDAASDETPASAAPRPSLRSSLPDAPPPNTRRGEMASTASPVADPEPGPAAPDTPADATASPTNDFMASLRRTMASVDQTDDPAEPAPDAAPTPTEPAAAPTAAGPAAEPTPEPDPSTELSRGVSVPGAASCASVAPFGRPTASAPPPTATAEPTATTPEAATYTVEGGDTMSGIAIKLYGSERRWVDIAQANPTIDPTKLKIGQVLKLPSEREMREAEHPIAAPGQEVVYTVRPGDTLSSIANEYYGKPSLWRTIFNANRDTLGTNPNSLQAGDRLRIPPAPVAAQ